MRTQLNRKGRVSLPIFTVTLAFAITFTATAFAQQKGTFKDARDGKTYKTVKIGEQVWMAENLNYSGEEEDIGWCYGKEATRLKPENCKKHGRLYDWSEAMDIGMEFLVKEWKGSDANRQGVCPAGWHLPSNDEWKALIDFTGVDSIAGKKLKSKSGWNMPLYGKGKCKYTKDGKQFDFCATDEFGFSALPGGMFKGGGYSTGSGEYHSYSGAKYAGSDGYWWSASSLDNGAHYAQMDYSGNKVRFSHSNSVTGEGNKAYLFSVRCVQNNADSKADAEVKTAAKTEAAKKASVGKAFTDPRDKKTYKSVKIGTETWMAENLSYNAEGSACYKNKDNPDEAANCAKYGRLYNWETAKKACPAGWHLPSNDEWDKLYRFADFTRGYGLYESRSAGSLLKAKKIWNNIDTDDYGFSALPGGGYFSSSSYNGTNSYNFSYLGNRGYWWSADEKDSDKAHQRLMYYDKSGAYHSEDKKSYLFSVRCVRD
jgi:uncharacterized protein (TIGR02145 family)